MAKFYSEVGFANFETDEDGVTREIITKKRLCCEEIRNNRRLENANQINDDIKSSNRISVVGNPSAYHNVHSIRYIVFKGTKWKVTEVEVQYPRLLLSLGGVYNGEPDRIASDF